MPLGRAPSEGIYSINTYGSHYDTVLYVPNGYCEGPELGCNDDDWGMESEVLLWLWAEQLVTIVVDGNHASLGWYELHVTSVPYGPCPDDDPGSTFPVELSGSTIGAADKVVGSCQVASGPDFVYEWAAPASGTYTIDTFGSTYDTVLYMLAEDCLGPEIACNDDTYELQSQVVVVLLEGETVVIVIDGFASDAGDFVLHIH